MKNHYGAASAHWLLAASLGAIAGSTLAAENDPGIGVTTHVDRIAVKQAGATPVIEVTAIGNQYDTVADGMFSMHYDASVSCKGLWDVHYFEVALGGSQNWYDVKGANYQHKPIGSYTDLLASWGVDTNDKSRSRSNRTLIGPIKPQLRDAAIDKCNVEAQNAASKNNISLAKAMSSERQFLLPKSGWVQSNLQLQAWTSCGEPQDHITWLSVFDGPPDISVRCKARPYAEGVDTGNMPNQLDNQFQVTQLGLAASPMQHQGSCPKDLELTGTVAVNKPGAIQYRWKSGNTLSAPKTLTFAKAESRQVTRTIEVDHSWSQTLTLLTDGPGKTESNSVDVRFACATTRVPTNLGVAPAPPPMPKPAPARQTSDLVPGATLTVGNGSASWGHTLTVNASKSDLGMQGEACGLRMNYDVGNIGQGNAGAFASRLFTPSATLHSGNVQSLAAGANRNISGTIFLPNGDYEVGALVDDPNKVGEANEDNNSARIRLKIRNCSAGGPGGNHGAN